eukprot:1710177-Amphidinium_carterae.1
MPRLQLRCFGSMQESQFVIWSSVNVSTCVRTGAVCLDVWYQLITRRDMRKKVTVLGRCADGAMKLPEARVPIGSGCQFSNSKLHEESQESQGYLERVSFPFCDQVGLAGTAACQVQCRTKATPLLHC